MSIRVLVVDPHEIMRAGIKHGCQGRDDIEVVGEAGSIEQCIEIARDLRPDVAVVDPEYLSVPDGSNLVEPVGIDQLRQVCPDLKILVFSSRDGREYADQAVDEGASGYLVKLASLDEIAVAIGCVHAGRTFISHTHQPHQASPHPVPRRQRSLSIPSRHTTSPGDDESDASPALSGREREVLSLLADGLTNRQVGDRLFLSVKTVETYRSRIMRKYQLRDRAGLVAFARRELTGRSAAV